MHTGCATAMTSGARTDGRCSLDMTSIVTALRRRFARSSLTSLPASVVGAASRATRRDSPTPGTPDWTPRRTTASPRSARAHRRPPALLRHELPTKPKTRRSPGGSFRAQSVEATTGFEPVNRGFADLRVEPLHHVARGVRADRTTDAGCPSRIRTSVHGSKVRCPTARRRGSGPKNGGIGAEDGTRTRDPHLGKVMLYQLSHFRLRSAHPEVVPRARFELATPRFSVACSTN